MTQKMTHVTGQRPQNAMKWTDHSAVPDYRQPLCDAIHTGWNEAEIVFTGSFLSHVECSVIRHDTLQLSTGHTDRQ